MFVVEGQPLITAGAEFLMSVILPHEILRQVKAAADILQSAANESRVSDASKINAYLNTSSNSNSAPPPSSGSWKIHSDLRVQLRWYDEEDEDLQVKMGGPGEKPLMDSYEDVETFKIRSGSGSSHGLKVGDRKRSFSRDVSFENTGAKSSTGNLNHDASQDSIAEELFKAAPSVATIAIGLGREMGWVDDSSSFPSSSGCTSSVLRGATDVARSFSFSTLLGVTGASPGKSDELEAETPSNAGRRVTPSTIYEDRDEEYAIASWTSPASNFIPSSFKDLTNTLHNSTYRLVEESSSNGALLAPLTAVIVPPEISNAPSNPSSFKRFPVLPLPSSQLELTVERVVSLSPGADLLAEPGTTTLLAASKSAWAARVEGEDENDDVEEIGGDRALSSSGHEVADIKHQRGPSSIDHTASPPSKLIQSNEFSQTESDLVSSYSTFMDPNDSISSLCSLATASLGGASHVNSPPGLPPSPRLLDASSYAYRLTLLLQRSEEAGWGGGGWGQNHRVRPAPPSKTTSAPLQRSSPLQLKLRMAVTECTAESAYSLVIPRVVLPLILLKRLSQLEHARSSLELFAQAMADGGQRGSWKDSQRSKEGNYLVKKLNSSSLAIPSYKIDTPLSKKGGSSSLQSAQRSIRFSKGGRAKGSTTSSISTSDAGSGFNLSLLYGRLVSHIEREEEAKAGAAWLVSRTLRLLSYVTDLAFCMKSICGVLPGLPQDTPTRLISSVRLSLLRAQFFSGPLVNPYPVSELTPISEPLEEGALETPDAHPYTFSSTAHSPFPIASSSSVQSTTVSTFKSSQSKKDRYSRWIATNLHVQLLGLSSIANGVETLGFEGIDGISVASLLPDANTACQVSSTHHTTVTVGAPAAHWSDFKGGSSLGQAVASLTSSLESIESANGVRRELAVNALWREVEDSRLSTRLRCDAVLTQALSAAAAALGSSLTSAFQQACTGITARAVVSSGLHFQEVQSSIGNQPQGFNPHSLYSSPSTSPAAFQSRIASASALYSWARHTHASLNVGFSSLRSWVVPGACTVSKSAPSQPPPSPPGFLITWQSLLSCVGKERGMLDDAQFVAGLLSSVRWLPIDAEDCGLNSLSNGVDPSIDDTLGVCHEDGGGDSISAVLSRLRPKVLSQFIRAIPMSAMTHLEDTFLEACKTLRCEKIEGGVFGAASNDFGLTFLLPIKGLRRAVEVGVLPDRLLPFFSDKLCESSQSRSHPHHHHHHKNPGYTTPRTSSRSLLPYIPLTVSFVSVGINEAAAAAEAATLMGSSSLKLQKSVNSAAVDTLGCYIRAATISAREEEVALEEWGVRIRGSIARAKAIAAASLSVGPGERVLLVSEEGAGDCLLDRVEHENGYSVLVRDGGTNALVGRYVPLVNSVGATSFSSSHPSSLSTTSSSPQSKHGIGAGLFHAQYEESGVFSSPQSAKDAAPLSHQARSIADWMNWSNPLAPSPISPQEFSPSTSPRATIFEALNTIKDALDCRIEEGTVSGEALWLLSSLCRGDSLGDAGISALSYSLNHPSPLKVPDQKITDPCTSALFPPVTFSGLGGSQSARVEAAKDLFKGLKSLLRRMDGGGHGAFDERSEQEFEGLRLDVAESNVSGPVPPSSSSASPIASHRSGKGGFASSFYFSPEPSPPPPPSSGESSSVSFLRVFEDTGRLLHSGRITSCKSAKDRTGMSVTLEEARLCALFEAGTLSAISAIGETWKNGNYSPGVLDGQSDRVQSDLLASVFELSDALMISEKNISSFHKQCARMKGAWGTGSCVSHHRSNTAVELFLCALGGGLDILPSVHRTMAPSLASVGGRGSILVDLPEPDEAVAADVVGMANFLREYGPRLANAEKNTGSYYYAFNALQRAFFPFQFQAPKTTIGGKHS